MLDDLLMMLNTTISSIGNYEFRKIARDEVNGLIISTCETDDCGPETALIDAEGVHPVERYPDRMEAAEGHVRWCEKAKTIEKVLKLGYGDLVDPEEITLVRE